jgi:hypothetical protein
MSRKRAKVKKDNAKKAIIAVILCLIIINALFYAFTHVEGISEYGDDVSYLPLSTGLITRGFLISPSNIFSVRLTEIFAIGFFYALFGVSSLTSTLWNITSYIGIIIVTFYTVQFFYDNKAALLSAFLVSIFPMVAKYAVNISEDIPLAFISSLAILLFLYAERQNKKSYYFFSGFSLVAVWLTSYEGTLVIVFLFLYAFIELLRKKVRIDRTTLYFIYGILFLFLVVFIYSYINSGKPFATITINENFYSAVGTSVNGFSTIPSAETHLNFYTNSMFDYNLINTFTHQSIGDALGTISNQLFGKDLTFESGLYFYLLIPIAVLLILFREKRAFFLMFWFAFLWLGLEFGPMHIGITTNPLGITYLLAHRLIRFLLIISVPLAGIIGIGLAKLLEPKNKIMLIFGCIVVAFILVVLYLNNYYTSNFWYYWQHYPAELTMQAANFVKTLNPSTPVYLEALYNNNIVEYSGGAMYVYLGEPFPGRVNFNIPNTTNCSGFQNDSYVIWAGPPHCNNWVNVRNITAQKDIPDYILPLEEPLFGYKITNIYFVK